MPARTPCIKCGAIGFVRWEHVLRGGRTTTEYYCGRCEHKWTVDDKGAIETNTPPDRETPPDRSR